MIDKDKLKESSQEAKSEHPERQVNNQRNKLRDLNESDKRKNKEYR